MIKIDQIYLEDMLEMILKIEKFLGTSSFGEFEKDEEKQFAVFHALEVLGEAANKLSENFEKTYFDFPVSEAVEMRNILIHGYDVIRLDVVWKTITDHLPELKQQLQSILDNVG